MGTFAKNNREKVVLEKIGWRKSDSPRVEGLEYFERIQFIGNIDYRKEKTV
jgi:hypothetical protein